MPKHCVLLPLIVLEYLCIPQIAPARLDHRSFFSRKCSRARKACPVLSLLLPFQRHTSRAALEPCVLIELCSFLPHRRPTLPRRCRRLEFWLTCPNFPAPLLLKQQNFILSPRRGQYWFLPAASSLRASWPQRISQVGKFLERRPQTIGERTPHCAAQGAGTKPAYEKVG
jgi:hypothetical protein